jgi:hypothetical protein
VWQLAQSPASVSALPWAVTSADGSARAAPMANALHKINDLRIARIGDLFPEPTSFRGIIGLLCRFAIPRRCDTNQIGSGIFPARNCDFRKRGYLS